MIDPQFYKDEAELRIENGVFDGCCGKGEAMTARRAGHPSKAMRQEAQKQLIGNHLIKEWSSEKTSKNCYVLPVPREQLRRIVSSSITHIGNLCNAIDFLVPEGTEIYAAASGVVTALKDDSNTGGPDPKYWYEGNYVVIKHNGESTGYEHFKHKGIVVKVGERVTQGQVIGYSGNTGYSRGPHLHFEVMEFFGPGDDDYVTLKAQFKDYPDVYEVIARSRRAPQPGK